MEKISQGNAITVLKTLFDDGFDQRVSGLNRALFFKMNLDEYKSFISAIESIIPPEINAETDMAQCPICGGEMGNYKSAECGYGVYCKGDCKYSVVGENCPEDARRTFNRLVGAF